MDELQVHREDLPQTNEEDIDNSSNGAKLELTVDEIIEQHVGSFGFSQLVHVFLVSLAWVFDSQGTLVTIFTDKQPAWQCKGGAACSSASASAICGLTPGSWEWVGGNKSSTVAEWGLICGNRFKAGVPASLFFIGSLFGSITHGRLADAYLGRKKTILLSCLLTAITTFLTSLSPNIWAYAFFRFANGFARSGFGICCIVLSTEVVGRKWRGQVGQYGFFFFTVGFLSLPLIAYPTRYSWRSIYRTISYLPLAYSLIVFPFVSESPRWLALKGRSDEAMAVLSKLAKLNGCKLPKNLSILNPNQSVNGVAKPESLWSVRWAARRMATIMIAGFGIGFVYYGVQLNVENLNFNLYFTVAVNALMEIPAVFVGGVLLSCMNRRVLFSLSSFLTGVTCFLCILFSKKKTSSSSSSSSKHSWQQLSLEAVGFMAVSMAFDILYIYCVELFPTNVRNFAVSMMRQTLMLGAAIAPMLVVMGRLSPALSFVVFGGFAIFSGILTVWLPETRHTPLYETFEQQEKEEKLGSSPGAPAAAETELAA